MKILNNLGYLVSEERIKQGLSTVIHRGRMEEIYKNPLIIYDGGHNEQAINNLKNTIKMYYKNYKKVFIISILKRKDYNKMLELLIKDDENYTFIFTSGNSEERYTTGQELLETAKIYKKNKQDFYVKTLEEAIQFVMSKKEYNTVNLIVGSFYVYGDVCKFLNIK